MSLSSRSDIRKDRASCVNAADPAVLLADDDGVGRGYVSPNDPDAVHVRSEAPVRNLDRNRTRILKPMQRVLHVPHSSRKRPGDDKK